MSLTSAPCAPPSGLITGGACAMSSAQDWFDEWVDEVTGELAAHCPDPTVPDGDEDE